MKAAWRCASRRTPKVSCPGSLRHSARRDGSQREPFRFLVRLPCMPHLPMPLDSFALPERRWAIPCASKAMPTDFEIQPPAKTPLTIPEVIDNIWQNVDRDYHVRILAKRLRRIEKDMSGRSFSANCRHSFVMANGARKGHACGVKFTVNVRKYSVEQSLR